jgi:hypothetical protein
VEAARQPKGVLSALVGRAVTGDHSAGPINGVLVGFDSEWIAYRSSDRIIYMPIQRVGYMRLAE